MCSQQTGVDIGSLLSDGRVGDAVAAAVVGGQGGIGMRLERNGSYLIPDTEDWISYAVKSTGFHFRLDKRVPTTMESLAPVMRDLVTAHGWDASRLRLYIIHAGGPRILDHPCRLLGGEPYAFRHRPATLTQFRDIASAAG